MAKAKDMWTFALYTAVTSSFNFNANVLHSEAMQNTKQVHRNIQTV